jgi:hypothetical protein
MSTMEARHSPTWPGKRHSVYVPKNQTLSSLDAHVLAPTYNADCMNMRARIPTCTKYIDTIMERSCAFGASVRLYYVF